MPNAAENKDINFQPKTKGYSYSTNGGSSKNSNPKTKDYRIYLLTGISLLIIILLAALLYLNNFGNIKTATKQFNLVKTKTKSVSLANDPKFKNYTKLANQATDAQILNYIALIAAKEIPSNDPLYPNEIYGIFSGYDDKYVQIVTYNGIKNLPYIKDLNILLFGQPVKESTSSGVTVGLTQIQKNAFFNKNMFGQVIKLSLVTPEAVQTIYLTE